MPSPSPRPRARGRFPVAGLPVGSWPVVGWTLVVVSLLIAVGFLSGRGAVEMGRQGSNRAAQQNAPELAVAKRLTEKDRKVQAIKAQTGAVEGVYASIANGADRVELVYQTPEAVSGEASEALLFLAHGCSHSATDFFDRSATCPSCIGLPIERHIVRSALQRRFAVVAVSSADRLFSKCWSAGLDAPRVFQALSYVLNATKLKPLPLLALGASSGGAMVHALGTLTLPDSLAAAGRARIAAVAVQIMPIDAHDMDEMYPPLILWHMPRDARSAAYISEAVSTLRAKRRPIRELTCDPFALTPSIFSDWMPSVPRRTSASLFSALKKAGMLDREGFLRDDPRGVCHVHGTLTPKP